MTGGFRLAELHEGSHPLPRSAVSPCSAVSPALPRCRGSGAGESRRVILKRCESCGGLPKCKVVFEGRRRRHRAVEEEAARA